MPAERKSPSPTDGKPFEYAWTFLGRRYRAVESEPGIVRYFATEEDSDNARYSPTDRPLGLTNELVHLATENETLLRQRDELAEAIRRYKRQHEDGTPDYGQGVRRERRRMFAALAKLEAEP